MTEKITPELLKSWSPCDKGYERFCELFPDGADLETAIEGLVADGHDNWGYWLFKQCKERSLFVDFISKGYRNSGYKNSGSLNSGDQNSGHRNSGNGNIGSWNSGSFNNGNFNSGNKNSGDCNSGNFNTGNRNSGNWNSGNENSGFFNTITPDEILVFNKPCKRSVWDEAYKPLFMFFELTYWVPESQMTDEEKAADPYFYVRGGQLRTRKYKDAWALAWDGASEKDREAVTKLPNFNADVFYEITGIRVTV